MTNAKAIELIKHYESLHDGDLSTVGLQPKLCPAGIWTEGYGHAMTDPITHKFLKGEERRQGALEISQIHDEAQAEIFLQADLLRFQISVETLIKVPISDEALGACVSLCYNIGIGNFQSSSVLKFINQQKTPDAADAFLMWTKANVNGKMVDLPGLVARRKSERDLFLYGTVKFYN